MASATSTSKRKRGDEAAAAKKRNYYKQIQGVKYDKGMLDVVETATADKGRINVEDCKKLLKEVIDGDTYTDIEKQTMKYIREHYKFEGAADQWIRRAISSWASKKAKKDKDSDASKKDEKEEKEEKLYCSCNSPGGGRTLVGCDANLAGCYDWYHIDCVGLEAKALPEIWFCPQCKSKKARKKAPPKKASYYKQIDGKKYDKGMLDAAEAGVAGKGDNGKISIDDAKIVFKEAVDGDKITDTEYDTLDYIRANFKWTPKAEEWMNNAIKYWEADHPRKKKRESKKKEVGEKKSTRAKKGRRAKTPEVDADGDTRIDTGSQKDED